MTTPRTPKKTAVEPGTVALVGAGPGDPDLLTLRAVTVLGQADVVFAAAERFGPVLSRCRPGVEIIDTTGPETDAELVKLIVGQVRAGRHVVRLFHGDPFVGCSGPALAQALARAKLGFELVAGISSVTGVPAYAGVPLTDASHHTFTTVDVTHAEPDWAAVAASETLVVMGVSAEDAGRLAKSLTAAGRPGSTPVSLTVAGSTPEQRTIVATLDGIEHAISTAQTTVAGPAVVVVGAVVKQRDKLSWYETRALFGWKVLVPRTREQAGALSQQLRAHGAVPVEVPTIAVEPPRTPAQMERAIKGLVQGRYQWVVFTSVNAWKAVRERIEEYGLDARAFAGIKIACIGEVTAAAVQAYGIKPDLVPSGEQSSEGLLADWAPYDDILDPIDRVLLPRADIATETLVAGLKQHGWEVDDVTAYRTVRAAPPAAETREAIKSGGFDAVLFTSSSTVRNLVGIAGKPHESTVIACIGPKTVETAQEHGLTVHVRAATPSVAALVEALATYADGLRAESVAEGVPFRPTERLARSRQRKRPAVKKPLAVSDVIMSDPELEVDEPLEVSES
ncbi:MAG: uroporphyrinogen methyltransferase / synthase [Frankiales bacterium]|nr:uroporphyrinogen methyltransferase / synthase [Frankiales bacterium]